MIKISICLDYSDGLSDKLGLYRLSVPPLDSQPPTWEAQRSAFKISLCASQTIADVFEAYCIVCALCAATGGSNV